MRCLMVLAGALNLLWCSLALGEMREWTDKSGHYSLDADLIAFNDSIVVLEKKNRDLVSMAIEELSDADREFLASKEAMDEVESDPDAVQTWTTRNGLKLRGRVISYGRKQVTLQRRRGKIYVNDKRFDNLPGVYKEMIPRIVGHFEEQEIVDPKGLEAWIKPLKGAAKTFTCDGVVLELENGDMYGVPFFLLSEEDQKMLQPGWERWLAAEEDRAAQERQAIELEAKVMASNREKEEIRETMRLQLQLQAYDAGLFDLWEVALYPTSAAYPPLLVVVPGRNSQQAAAEALKQYPGYDVGPIAKVRRRR